MQPRRDRWVLLVGGPLAALALSTCTAIVPAAVTATDPPRTPRGPAEAAVTAVDPPRRELDAARRLAQVTEDPAAADEPVLADIAGPAPEPEPEATTEPEEALTRAAALAAQPVSVVIPRIGVNHTMVPVGLHPDRTLVVPDTAHVAGWYTGAPLPGETGPAVVVGHNAWNGSRGVFWDLRHVVPGDVVEVGYDDGSAVRFAVERIEQYPKAAFPTQRVYGNTPRQELRLITCGGTFDRGQGRHLDNIVVFGVRIP